MSQASRKAILLELQSICQLSPSIRFGQLIANLGFLAEDMFDKSLWDIQDEDLLKVVERHQEELSQREPNPIRSTGGLTRPCSGTRERPR